MPRRITIDPMPFLNETFGKGLVKDLHDTEAYTEEICSRCKGTGLQIADNPYGLKENKIPGNLFPYKVQALIPCRECAGKGIRKRCNYCGELFPLYRLKCNCDTQRKKDEAEDRRKWQERIDSMRFATDEEIAQCKAFSLTFIHTTMDTLRTSKIFSIGGMMSARIALQTSQSIVLEPMRFHLRSTREILWKEPVRIYTKTHLIM